jgi:hypothetical protein
MAALPSLQAARRARTLSTVPDPAGTPGFRHRVAEHGASGALRDLLEHHGASYSPEPLSEGAVFGLSGALDLRIRIAGTALPAVDIDGRAPSLELELCRHLGMPAEWCSTADPSAGWEMLRVELAAGRPTLLRADLGKLDPDGERRHDTRHAVVVTSFDAQAGVVWVADRRFPEPQRCTLAALAAARASEAWPEPVRHGMLRIGRPAHLAEPAAAVAAALTRVVRRMRPPHRFEHPHVRHGLDAIDALAGAWPRLADLPRPRLGQTLAAMRFRVLDGGCDGALFRSLQARFEHDAAALLGSVQLGRAALVCDDLADAWRTFGAALGDEDADRAHQVAAPWLERIRELEHRHVAALEEQLGLLRALVA